MKITKEFDTVKEKIAYLIANKEELISAAKSTIKEADGHGLGYKVSPVRPATASKDDLGIIENGVVTVKAVINTTSVMDSHDDVHIPGLWTKTLQENKRPQHLQEHVSRKFDHIISDGDDLQVSVVEYSWAELGIDAEGKTEALVFDSKVRNKRNPFMYDNYKNKWVTNHSVGMRYMKLYLAVNEPTSEQEYIVWNKYIGLVLNRKEAEEKGYFWAVTEAQFIEGSAVPNGSNPITPTLAMKAFDEPEEQPKPKSATSKFLGL